MLVSRAPLRTTGLAVAALLLVAGTGPADIVTLVNGKTLEGKITEQTDTEVVIETTFDGVKRVPKAEVKVVDTRTPPLREQLRYRLEEAGTDVAKLWEAHAFAKSSGFKDELTGILEQIVRQKPDDARARKGLGHVKVDGAWMTPAQVKAHEEAKFEAGQRAKGLVPHDGRWVTPKEKDALEKGLLKDGDDWVTEEEFHRRRGEEKVDGKWIRVGEKEAKAYAADAGNAARVTLTPYWGPHFDVLAEVDAPVAQQSLAGLEKAYAAMRRALEPEGDDLPETLEARIRVAMFKKAPAYARFAAWYGARNKVDSIQPKWSNNVQRQNTFWWVQDEPMVALYQFPNIDKTVVSNAVHDAGLVLLTRYRMNYRIPKQWLVEGFAYHLEMESLGYSLTFTLGRGGGTSQGGGDTAPPWAESSKWKETLKAAVAGGQDPPLKRLAAMTSDQMGYPELVKSWSVVDFLIQWDQDKFKAYVDATKADRDGVDEDALMKATSMTFRQLDDKWRAWVTGGFGKP
jgi:hypothetical protein